MKYKLFQKNMGLFDRTIRVVIGLIVLGAWFFGAIVGTVAIFLGIMAVILIGTSAASSCPAYTFANVNTLGKNADKVI